jgi:hypothetical protein
VRSCSYDTNHPNKALASRHLISLHGPSISSVETSAGTIQGCVIRGAVRKNPPVRTPHAEHRPLPLDGLSSGLGRRIRVSARRAEECESRGCGEDPLPSGSMPVCKGTSLSTRHFWPFLLQGEQRYWAMQPTSPVTACNCHTAAADHETSVRPDRLAEHLDFARPSHPNSGDASAHSDCSSSQVLIGGQCGTPSQMPGLPIKQVGRFRSWRRWSSSPCRIGPLSLAWQRATRLYCCPLRALHMYLDHPPPLFSFYSVSTPSRVPSYLALA